MSKMGMLINKSNLGRKISQRGFFTISISIAIMVATLIAIGSAKVALNSFNTSTGAIVGNQLQTVDSALASYISANSSALTSSTPSISGVSNPFKPTIAELKSLSFLNSNFSGTPTSGGAYNTSITVTPSGCTSGCQVTGAVWFSNPIYTGRNRNADIYFFGGAMSASTTSQIGFSTTANPSVISGPGWSFSNPDASLRAGILYATTSLSSLSPSQYWLQSTSTYSALPSTGNTLGDGRLTKDTAKPFMWNGTAWRDLFSSTDTTSVSIGPSSGQYGTWNTFIGQSSGNATQPDGVSNTMVGYQSGFSNTSGSNNVFAGSKTGFNNTTGTGNLFNGFQAGYYNTTGSNNVFAGTRAGYLNTTADANVFSGFQAGYSNTYGSNNVFAGTQAGYSNIGANSNVFSGYMAGYANTYGSNNVFAGTQAGYSNTNGLNNVFSGYQAGYSNTNGLNNVFSGYQAGYSNTTGSNNVFVGTQAGYANTTGYYNVIIGNQAGMASTLAYDNVFIGNAAGTNSSGYRNSFVGSVAGRDNTTGQENSFFGALSGLQNTAGFQNTFMGAGSGVAVKGGVRNAFFGYYSGYLNVNSNNNTAIGNFSGPSSDGLDNTTSLGYLAQATASNSVQIGGNQVNKIGGYAAWSNISDRRLKTDIKNSSRGLDFLRKLRPVDYILKDNKKPETGFIAQEVEEADSDFPGIHKPENDKDFYSLAYTDFIPSIVKAIQELDARNGGTVLASAQKQAGIINYLCKAIIVLGMICMILFGMLFKVMGEVSQIKRKLASECKCL